MNRTLSTKRLSTCFWIVNAIERHGGLSLKELNELWMHDDLSGGKPISRRNFSGYLLDIVDLLKVLIECDVHDRYRYKITANFADAKTAKWVTQSMCVAESVSRHFDLNDRILLEDIPGGCQWLDSMMDAMHACHKVSFGYRRFDEDRVRTVSMAEPYCLKLFQQRWYVLVKVYRTLLVSHQKVGEMRVFALDRIQDLQVEEELFKLDRGFDALSFFKDVLGTQVDKNRPVENVRIRVDASVAPYLRSLPWHPTMEEVERTAHYSIFCLQVALSAELYQQIAKFCSRIEVLEPKDLRDVMHIEAWKMAELYGIVEPLTEEVQEGPMGDRNLISPELADEKFCRDAYAGFSLD